MPRPSSRDTIMDAAEAVVVESGALHMTLEAVSERAGISKGGLMYHFPTKESLLAALMDRMMANYDRLRDQAREELAGQPFNELMVEVKFMQSKSMLENNRLGAGMLAVVANQPELVAKTREALRERFFNKIVADGPLERASILFFAVMGLHFHDILHFSLLDAEQKQSIFNELMRLAQTGQAV